MLRILANENVPGPVVRSLRQLGHDVSWVREAGRGASDAEVLRRALAEQRVVVTFDKDFGDLAFRARLPTTCGVVLVRLRGTSPATDNARAVAALAGRSDWCGHFSIVEDDRVRRRKLPD